MKTYYKECLKNYAAAIGETATDGCGEFMPNGEEGTIEALKGITFLMVLHGVEKKETDALLLSTMRPAFKNPADADLMQNGSQSTFFLTAHMAHSAN
ncbi:hypothetical protein ACFX2H_022845 [Malus domestica]